MGKVRNATMFANQPRRTTTTYTYNNTSVAEKPAAGRRFGTNLSNQFTKYNDVLEKKAEAKPAAKPAAARPYTYNAPVAANKYTRPATAAQPKAAAPKPFQAATQRAVDDLTSQVSSINIGNVNVSAAAPQRASSAVDSSSDRREPQMVCSYINEILASHRRVEPKFQSDQYIESGKQTQVSKKVRCTLVDWVVEVHRKFKLIPSRADHARLRAAPFHSIHGLCILHCNRTKDGSQRFMGQHAVN